MMSKNTDPKYFGKTLLSSIMLFLLFHAMQSNAQGYLKVDGKRIVNEKGDNVLLRGMGLGGWMLQEGYMLGIHKEGQQHKIRQRIQELIGKEDTDDFYKKWLNNNTTKADIDFMKAWGFNSVRLAMHYNLYTLPIEEEPVSGQNTWLDKGFNMTDSLLAWCKANEMYLILDLHAAPGGQGNDFNISDRDGSKPSLWDSETNQQKAIALWRKLAERYVDEPWIGAYNLINEPNWGFENPSTDKNGLAEKKNIPLRKLMVEMTNAIREVDKKHIIIIEGNGWGNNYNGIFPLWDNNIVISFHKYWAFNDQASAQGMINVREEQNAPIWLGETGENSNVWFTEAIRLFEKNNIGWAWWPLKKLGHNNPIQVKSNPEYDAVLKYWNGKGDKPSASLAKKGLMKLTDDLKIKNSIIHYDVLDAMFRQPFSNETKPFKKHLITQSSTIKAVDYDFGRNGQAYNDKDTADYHVSTGKTEIGNRGRVYRNDGVDIIKRDGLYIVNHIEAGEWLQYTIDIDVEGKYALKLNMATKNVENISVMVDDQTIVKNRSIPNTGSLLKDINIADLSLKTGEQKIKIYFNTGSIEFNNLTLSKK